MSLHRQLLARAEAGRPIRVGMIGAGKFGSMYLAQARRTAGVHIVGLADLIVDLVESGNTLKANGLVPLELITHISSRLVVNKASWKMKHGLVMQLMEAFREAVQQQAD